MKKIYNSISLFLIAVSSVALTAQTSTYNYTGAVQTYTVPPCVTTINVTVLGAKGGTGPSATGGLGGSVQATIPVTPGEILNIYVGQAGINNVGSAPPVFNGGGGVYSYSSGGTSGTGGGASDIRRTPYTVNDRLVVAGGGGGGGYGSTNGGNGGGLIGQDGVPYPTWPNAGGKGGTQSVGGAGGIACCSCPTYTTSGALAQGGNGSGDGAGGGGGGGGYFGGGGACFSGGGGGSSFAIPAATSVVHVQGFQNGAGQVLITPGSTGAPSSPGTIAGLISFCEASSGSFSINPVGGATSYTWSVPAGSTINSGQGTTSINVTFGSTSGNISVTADNICGSSAPTTLAVTINPTPTVSATAGSPTICNGASTTIVGSGASTYDWMPGSLTGSSITVSPSSTQTYTLTGTSSGCFNTTTVTITVNPLPNVTANTSAAAVCDGSSVTLTGSGASSYSWTGSVTDGVPFVPTATSIYTVTGTDANSCMNTATIMVTVNPLPTITANSTAAAICDGGSVTLTGSGAISYTWTGSVTDGISFTPSATSTYTVTGTDANGCTNTSSTTVIVNPLPTVSGSASATVLCLIDAGASLSGAPIGGIWSGPGFTGSTFIPSTAGAGIHIVTYTFTDGNGCTDSASVFITVDICTGIVPSTLENSMSILPNPNSGIFNVSVNTNVGDLKIEMVDLQGRVVFSSLENNVQTGFVKQINMENIANGVYMLRMTTNKEQTSLKVTVQK